MTSQWTSPVHISDMSKPAKENSNPSVDSDPESENSPDTPRSNASSDCSSSLITTPRYGLLWDHGYELGGSASPETLYGEREGEWRKFNKTDDDKLLADINASSVKSLIEMSIRATSVSSDEEVSTPREVLSNELPDLISSMSSMNGKEHLSLNVVGDSNSNTMDGYIATETDVKVDNSDEDTPPPLPDSSPPVLCNSECQPPLPWSSPQAVDNTATAITISQYVCSTGPNETNTDDELRDKTRDNTDSQPMNDDLAKSNQTTKCPPAVDTATTAITVSQDVCSTGPNDTNTDGELRDKTRDSTDSQPTNDDLAKSNQTTNCPPEVDTATTAITVSQGVYSTGLNETNTDGELMDKSRDSTNSQLTNDDLAKNNHTPNQSESLSDYDSVMEQYGVLLKRMSEKDQFDKDVEDEFEAIINALDLNYMDETYVERFADRRDRYGFILSPVVEAPSPTPSSLSGYSGLSSVSPDPLSMFRMSPRPGSRTDLDLSSLGIVTDDWDISLDGPVPIYQTVQAKRAVVIPDGYGWESGDDILSGSGEWELDDGALRSPPISTQYISLSQFGSHVLGFKQPDAVILEEAETTSNEEDGTDSDETINGDQESANYTRDMENADTLLESDFVDDEELTETLEGVIGKINISNEDDLNLMREVMLGVDRSNLNTIIQNTDIESGTNNEETTSVIANHIRADSNISNQTSEYISPSDNDDDAEDEMSDTDESTAQETTDGDNSDSEFFKNKKESIQRVLAANNDLSDDDDVCVSEVMSPRTAILLAGGMFPINDEETSSSSYTSESEEEDEFIGHNEDSKYLSSSNDQGTINPQIEAICSDINVTQYTSDDSDTSAYSNTRDTDTHIPQKTNNIVSFRGKYKLDLQESPQPENKHESQPDNFDVVSTHTPTVQIVSPLDFSLFGDSLVHAIKNEGGGRSPRVLGRYYSEMDEDIVEQSLSPPVTDVKTADPWTTSPVDLNSGILSNKHVYADGDMDYDSSFMNITFKHLENVNAEQNDMHDNDQNIADDSSDECSEKENYVQTDDTESNRTCGLKNTAKSVIDNTSENLSDHSSDECSEKENYVQTDHIESNRSCGLKNTAIQVIENTSEYPKMLPNNCSAVKGKQMTSPVIKSLNKKNAKSQSKSPVQIKISHLKRNDSTRNKIKKGFVHQLSELFVSKGSESSLETEGNPKKKKTREMPYAKVNLPALLTANENIVISRGSVQDLMLQNTADIQGDSLGFEVTPLECVPGFDEASSETSDNASYLEQEVDGIVGDTDDDDSSPINEFETANINIEHYTRSLMELEEEIDDSPIPEEYLDIDNEVTTNAKNDDCKMIELSSSREKSITESSDIDDNNEGIGGEFKSLEQNANITIQTEFCNEKVDAKPSNIILDNNNGKTDEHNAATLNEYEPDDVVREDSEEFSDMQLFKKWIYKPSQNAPEILSLNRRKPNVGQPVTMSTCDATKEQELKVEQSRIILSIQPTFRPEQQYHTNDLDEGQLAHDLNVADSNTKDIHIVEEHTSKRKRSFLKERNEKMSKLDLQNDKGKVQYPASLSRALYGPYIRQRQKSPHNYSELDQREVTSDSLSHTWNTSVSSPDRCQTIDTFNVVTQKQNLTESAYHCKLDNIGRTDTDQHEPRISQRPLFLTENISDDSTTKKCSKLDRDNNIWGNPEKSVDVNGDVFQHTLYMVDTPVITISDRAVDFNLKPITNFGGNEAKRLYQSENNFANANTRSPLCPRGVNADTCDDNIKTGVFEGSCLNKTGTFDLSVKQCGDKLYTGISDNVLQCEQTDGFHDELKNGIFQQQKGVHNNTECSNVSDDTFTSLKMKENGPLIQTSSVEVKVSPLGINDLTSTETVTVNQPYMSGGRDIPRDDDSQLKESCKNVPAAWTRDKQVSVVILPPDCQHVLEDEKGNLKVWPYSEFDNSDELSVTLHKATRTVKVFPHKGMNDISNSMTIIQSAQHSTEVPENKMMTKYHSSYVMPTDNSEKDILQTHSDSIKSVLLQDANGNMVSDEELAKILPKIAESVARMETIDAEEILPGITQSVTKLRNGGNLVITTMTRKIDEVDSDSSGRGSPESSSHPILNVDDLENSKIYLVEDSNGELFYVEDITNESQESAYSSRHTSESVSDVGSSTSFKGISKIHQLGNSGINNSTAEEILSAMYNDGAVHEMTENEEEWSERTYEYDIPRRRQDGYSKDSYNTSYVVEEPDTMPRTRTTTKDKYETSYEMAENQPWVIGGGQMQQSYSQATHGFGVDRTDGASTIDNVDHLSTSMGNVLVSSGVTGPGYTTTQEAYTVEAESQEYPLVPYRFEAPTVFAPPPPVCIQADIPQYSLVKVNVTPPQKEESVISRVDVTQHNKVAELDERPIFKTVAHIQTGEKHPRVKNEMSEKKKYKIISSKASPVKEEEQESHMSFGELDYRYTTENVEMKQSPTLQTRQCFVRDSTRLEQQKEQSETRYRSEKNFELGKSNNTTTIDVKSNNASSNDMQTYEERTYSFDQTKTSTEPSDANMRVIRGSYLIKNNLDDVDGEYDDNINMFDGNFVLSKENPLYQSDEDIYKRLDREKAEHAQRQDRFRRDYTNDVTFESVDKFSKSKTVKREENKPKQSVTEILMSKLSTIDSKDIHQKIDVKHHAEDIYGDPRFLHADGSNVQSSGGTNDFDTVGEKVDLLLKEGKAYITVKVTAERITPIDIEFNVWRKNQAIVTRIIEVDLLATEQRRRLYYKVMEEQPTSHGHGRWGNRGSPNETVLDGHQTLELFSRILGAAEGEGDKEDVTVKTRLTNTHRPFSSGMDLMY